jgi:Secretion system C-terminal sorting domain
MKKHYFFTILLIGLLSNTKAQTTLVPGDIAFILINATDNTVNSATNDDNVSFVLLKAVTTNTKISFTDFGWRTDAQAFQTANPCGASTGSVTDGIVTWTATTNLPYGTKVHMNVRNNPSVNVGSIATTQAAYNSTISPPAYYVSMSSVAGESVIAYQGTASSPTPISAVRMNSSWSATLTNCEYTPTSCSQPTALTGTGHSLLWGQVVGNGRIKPSITLTGNRATDLATLYNISNWDLGSSAYSTTTVLGIDDFTKNNIKIYPNPASNKIQLDVNEGLKYTIIDAIGKTIKKGIVSNKEIDIQYLNSGLYFLELKKDSQTIIRKFIKE